MFLIGHSLFFGFGTEENGTQLSAMNQMTCGTRSPNIDALFVERNVSFFPEDFFQSKCGVKIDTSKHISYICRVVVAHQCLRFFFLLCICGSIAGWCQEFDQ